MAFLARVGSSLAGVALLNAACFFSTSSLSGAAWGWELSPPAGSNFACSQGATVGAAGGKASYSASDYECTVTPAAGYACDQTTISVQCSKNSGAKAQPNTIMCINHGGTMGGNTVVKDSELSWSATPTCSKESSTSASPRSVHSWPLLALLLAGASRLARLGV